VRLTVTQNKLICETAEKYFGSDVHVWLFGSRVNDNAKGGDIDLYIESTK
jgi:predicted nucleotidyltransferase